MSSKYQYKESGIRWIGKIPSTWKCIKLKRILAEKLMYGATESGEEENYQNPRYIRITDFDDAGNLKDDTFKSLPIEIAAPYLLKEGDVLFARSGATVGKTFIFKNYNGIACFAGYLIKADLFRAKMLPEYLFYYTKSRAYDDWKNVIFTQATIQNIGADKYQYLDIPLPKIKEQTAIANYLDKACANIDKVVELKSQQRANANERCKSLIAEIVTKGLNKNVNLVECRIPWLKTIPENWTVSRLKSIADLRSGDGITSENISDEGDFPVYGGNGLRGYTNSFTHEGNFALIGRQGALCGNINYTSGKFFASEHAVVLTPIRKYDTLWLGELLRYMNLNQYSNAAAQPGLSVEKIRNLHIPLPKYEEQVVLSSQIKKVIKSTELLVEKIDQQITTLEDYKKALIHEVVTGKKQIYIEVEKTISKTKVELNAVE